MVNSGASGRLRRRWSPLVCCCYWIVFACAGCGHSSTGLPVQIEISHTVGDEALGLGTDYQSSSGQSWSAQRMSYYLSNFRLRRTDGSWFVNPQRPDSDLGYFLIDESAAASKRFRIGPVPAGSYAGLQFLVGIDPQRNSAGAQTGTLDPARGMYWTWHTGYIFFLLDGHSPQSSEPDHGFAYHVGATSESPARSVFLPLQPAVNIDADNSAELHLHADLAPLFDGPKPVDLSASGTFENPAMVSALADHAAQIFRMDHIHRLPKAGLAQGS